MNVESTTPRPTADRSRASSPLAMVALAILIAGCGSTPSGQGGGSPTIRGAFAPGAEIPESGSFSFAPHSGIAKDPRLATQKVDTMISEALVESMGRRGFQHIEAGSPDLVVAFVAATASTLEDVGFEPIPGARTDWREQSLDPQRYEQGTLVIDLMDPSGRKTLWRGTVQGAILFDLPDAQRRQRIRQLIEQVLSRFRR